MYLLMLFLLNLIEYKNEKKSISLLLLYFCRYKFYRNIDAFTIEIHKVLVLR